MQEGNSFGLPDQALQRLQVEYRQSIPEKLSYLEYLVNQLSCNPEKETLQALRNAVHKLAGSAGTYGYHHVSKVCKEFDLKLMKNIEAYESVGCQKGCIIQYQHHLEEIKDGFSNES